MDDAARAKIDAIIDRVAELQSRTYSGREIFRDDAACFAEDPSTPLRLMLRETSLECWLMLLYKVDEAQARSWAQLLEHLLLAQHRHWQAVNRVRLERAAWQDEPPEPPLVVWYQSGEGADLDLNGVGYRVQNGIFSGEIKLNEAPELFGLDEAPELFETVKAIEAAENEIARFIRSAPDQDGWLVVMAAAALVCVDRSIECIEAGEPYKAGAWAAQARGKIGPMQMRADSRRQLDLIRSRIGRDAAAKRHAHHHKARAQALELYRARSWLSAADAARHIALEVHKTPQTVERWLRADSKASAGRP